MKPEFVFNGIDAETGQYLLSPKNVAELASLAKAEPRDVAVERRLSGAWRTLSTASLGLPFDVKPEDVRRAGWAIVFHQDERDEVKKALEPLVEHRGSTVDPDRVKVLQYRTRESWSEWLTRHSVAPGTVNPTSVPFYLLFIGGPHKIPFTFTQILDIEYAVGCLEFDEPQTYSQYVESLIEYESSASVPNSREAVFFATRHPADESTQRSADDLVSPLVLGSHARGQSPQPSITEQVGFRGRTLWGDAAVKAALIETFRRPAGHRPPAFLFTGSHGMGYRSTNALSGGLR